MITSLKDLIDSQLDYNIYDVPFKFDLDVAVSNAIQSATIAQLGLHRCGTIVTLPNPPTGYSNYIPLHFCSASSIGSTAFILGRVIDMGSLNLATNTFTDGSAAPTELDGGVNRRLEMMVIYEAITAISGTSPAITITYNTRNNTGRSSGSISLQACSVGTCSFLHLNNNPTDNGVTDITGVSATGSSLSGTIKFWGVKSILTAGFGAAFNGVSTYYSLVTDQIGLTTLPAGARIELFSLGSSAVKGIFGYIRFILNPSS